LIVGLKNISRIFFLLLFAALMITAVHAQDNRDQNSCTVAGCHDNLFIYKVIHPPIEDGCELCHEATGEPHPEFGKVGFKLVSEVPELCEACHDPLDPEQNSHAPVAEGECLTCHNPHSSLSENLLVEKKVADLCGGCHDAEIWEGKTQHQPVKDDNCLSCHNAHQSKFEKLLTYEIPDLCFKCHEKVEKQHNLDYLHPPFESDCMDCHPVHKSDRKRLLTDKVPGLCFGCHEDFLSEADENTTVHKPVANGKSCLSCHSPHATKYENVLIKEQTDLCLSCHSNNDALRELKIFKADDDSKIHAPVTDGCTGCHQPHVSQNSKLLMGSFPDGNYATGETSNYELCFECHDSDLLTLETTEDATNFRDGSRNLHYLHVNREKGRTCIDCHNVHVSKQPHLIGEKVPFGKWKMPIVFEVLEDGGGSCLPGCHKKYEYHPDGSTKPN